jgi:ABC-type glycerol-3-phosphate transport system permease component
MTPTDLLGWFASSIVFATFCARRMVPLRALAAVSNLAFIGYGCSDHLWPIVALHTALLPVNVVRLRQALSGTRPTWPRRREAHPAQQADMRAEPLEVATLS